jgi:hypothetical protein
MLLYSINLDEIEVAVPAVAYKNLAQFAAVFE